MTLKKVAKKMKDEARQKGYSQHTLERGLQLNLYEREHDTVLSVSRPSALVVPSNLEITICKEAFFGDTPLKEFVWSARKCFMAVEKQ